MISISRASQEVSSEKITIHDTAYRMAARVDSVCKLTTDKP